MSTNDRAYKKGYLREELLGMDEVVVLVDVTAGGLNVEVLEGGLVKLI